MPRKKQIEQNLVKALAFNYNQHRDPTVTEHKHTDACDHSAEASTPTVESIIQHRLSSALKDELTARLPSPEHPEFYFRNNWVSAVLQGNGLISCDFVSQLGKQVNLIDIRTKEAEVVGSLGHIPAAEWVPGPMLLEECAKLDKDSILVLVCADDFEAVHYAQEIKRKLDMPFVAAMKGGLRAWRQMGFSTTRDPSILQRKGVIFKKEKPSPTNASSGDDGPKVIQLKEIENHIGNAANINWLKMAAFMVHSRQACIDGRDESALIGVAGGSMGEFIMQLGVLEELTGKPFTRQQVFTLFGRRLDAFGRFYMHTDLHTVDKLQQSMASDPRLTEVITPLLANPLEYRHFMRCPPLQYRDAIMEHQVMPQHIGCGHLKLMMTKKAQYRVRPGLCEDALRAFFTHRWEGAIECEYVMLSGHHCEGAVVNVHLDERVAPFTKIPLISPSYEGRQIFVSHPQISSFLRKQQALFWTLQTDIIQLSEGAKDEFYPKIEATAGNNLRNTVGHLAPTLPVYDVRFKQNGGFECTEPIKFDD